MMSTQELAKFAYRITEACTATGLSRSFLYEQMAEGKLRAFKVGSRTLIATEDLLSWFEAYKTKSSPKTEE